MDTPPSRFHESKGSIRSLANFIDILPMTNLTLQVILLMPVLTAQTPYLFLPRLATTESSSRSCQTLPHHLGETTGHRKGRRHLHSQRSFSEGDFRSHESQIGFPTSPTSEKISLHPILGKISNEYFPGAGFESGTAHPSIVKLRNLPGFFTYEASDHTQRWWF